MGLWPRSEVKEAVRLCRSAGIKIIMITGDYGLTAESIARKIGIIQSPDAKVISGVELAEMDDTVLKEVLKGEVVFARMAPEQKYRIVCALQEMGNIVAVTGDGVNDSPALKKADIGIAMGAMGSDAAIEAADIVLMDDDPAKISLAMRISRKCMRIVYQNIVFALAVKALCLILTALGITNMWWGVFADVGVMILAVLNATRMLNVKEYQ